MRSKDSALISKMVDIDPNDWPYIVCFKVKNKRQNKRDDKFEILRQVLGIRDTNNYQDLVKEALKTRNLEYKNNPNLIKDKQTIVDINLYEQPIVNIRLTKQQAARLAKDPNIQYVERSTLCHAAAETIPWGVTRVGGGSAIDGTKYHKGAGVRCAVADSGCDFNHDDLKPNYKGGMTAVAGTTTPMDDFNQDATGKITNEYHGTHVAGSLCAAANNTLVVGVACEAWLYAVKVLDKTGAGQATDVLEGYTWCNANNMQVVNSSFAGFGFIQSLADAIHTGFVNNCFFGCATGNNGIEALNYPSAFANAWGVGSVDKADVLSSFSDWGPAGSGMVDFVGPGGSITSANPKGDVLSDMPGNKTQMLAGTSMATPHISGLAALAFANYRFNPCDTNTFPTNQPKIIHIVGAMISSCDTLGQTQPGVQSQKFGFGLPRAAQIMKLLSGV